MVETLQSDSALSIVTKEAAQGFQAAGCRVDIIDLKKEPPALFDPESSRILPDYGRLQARVDNEITLLATRIIM